MNCPFYLEFLFDEMITTPDNILMKTMMHILVSSEMIAMTRVYVILHLSISLPMRFLAGKLHEFKDWSCRSMGRGIDLLETNLELLVADGELFLNETFMMGIFKPIADENEMFREFLLYMFEAKVIPTSNKAGSNKVSHKEGKEIVLDKVRCEAFYPSRIENKHTDSLVMTMAVGVSEAFLAEL